ncbi:hypothetical protein TL16_g09982 [Triparma laevis f. inornata]|uniref:Ion transport domain-containing protein n=1 Tax=Triparma laevis f. inornata TaxID=1714386 RepID=A0A9W7B5S3_9STRA|nr:hypothetical protein TL16_g09982 [Triparma laevis f. inornata]
MSAPVNLDEAESLITKKMSIPTIKAPAHSVGAAPPTPAPSLKDAGKQPSKGFAGIMGLSKAVNKFKGMGKKKASNQNSQKKNAFLIDAASRGSLDLVQKFITENECSPNLKNGEGKSLVQLALEGGHDTVVMYLFLEHNALVVPAKQLRNIKEDEEPDCLHISLLRQCVEKSTDRDKAFQVACESMAHSSNPVLTGLLLAEMYKEVAKSQPTHRHTLLHNSDIIGKVSFTMLDSVREEDVMHVLGGTDPAYGNESPISVAIRSHNSHFISHPLTQDYVGQIWKGDDPLQSHFGEDEEKYMAWDFVQMPKKFFGSPRGHFFLYIYTYIMFIVVNTIVSNKLSFELGKDDGSAELPDAWEHMFTVLTICGLINEIEKAYRQGMEQYLEFFWNYADVLLFVLLLAFIVMRNYEPWSSPIIVRNVLGLSAIPLYIRLLELLVLSRRFGPLMLIIQHVVSEVFYFLFLALLMIVAFAQCMTMIFNDPGRELEIFKDFGHSCGTLFIAMLGILDEGEVQNMREKYVWMGPSTIILYLLITSVILLNLLIAILSNIYKKIDEKSNEEWMFLWGSTVMKLQKEVATTLPPPLNVIHKLCMVFPKKIREKLTFSVLFVVAYVPGVVILTILYIPYRILSFIGVMVNLRNWKRGKGNPFLGARVDMLGNESSSDMNNGKNDRMVRGTALAQFFEDNFTNMAAEMRGREQLAYQYHSKQRPTIMDEQDLLAKNKNAYAQKIQQKREDLKELISVSTGDPMGALTDVQLAQDNHTKIMEETFAKMNKLSIQMGHLEKLIQIANRNMNQVVRDQGEMKGEIKSAAALSAAALEKSAKMGRGGGGRTKTEGEEGEGDEDEDEDEDEGEENPSLFGMGREIEPKKRATIRTSLFAKPRRTTRHYLKGPLTSK